MRVGPGRAGNRSSAAAGRPTQFGKFGRVAMGSHAQQQRPSAVGYQNNNRPVLPLNGRVVKFRCKE